MKLINMFILFLKKIKLKIAFWISIGWVKTVYFNLKMLPVKQAIKLPVVFYGKVKFLGLGGKVIINSPIKFGMVGFGQKYEIFKTSKKNAQITINGNFIVNGHIQFGIDYLLFINQNATLSMGHLSSLGANGKIICMKEISFGDYARIGYESQVIDTTFHQMIDLSAGELTATFGKISIGNYNYIGSRVSILKSSFTPDNCTVTSNSLLTKDYSEFGSNVMIGGIPAKLIKKNIRRAWEHENIDNFLTT